MKKFMIFIMLAGIIFFSISSLNAKGIGIKGGYTKMLDDYNDLNYDDTWNIGFYFDLGTFLHSTLRFMPGLDFVELERDEIVNTGLPNPWPQQRIASVETNVWGIHIDWYWFFIQGNPVSPFIGFGPSLNYYDQPGENDSDAGIEGFGGIEFDVSGPLSLLFEGRFVLHDIADREKTLFKANFGLCYNF
ncbi:MAG: hypothetical protein GY870_08630 [archaeon]|nr:hypothetical protein [archaeon]